MIGINPEPHATHAMSSPVALWGTDRPKLPSAARRVDAAPLGRRGVGVAVAVALGLASWAPAQPVLITNPTTIGPQATTVTPTGGGAAVPLATAEITVRGTTLTVNGRHTIASLALENTATLSHSQNTTFDYSGNGSDIVNGMAITVLGSASIQASSRIDVSGAGSLGGTGPGLGTLGGGPCGGAGSGYGGAGGHGNCADRPGGPAYGSATQPTDFGSGGAGYPGVGTGGRGGGAVRLIVGGTLLLAGSISANGLSEVNGAGGAGGSIWISAHDISGSGTLSANGGAEGTTNESGGGGGGGRIAVTDSCTLSPAITFSVQGGAAPVNQTGGAGTAHIAPGVTSIQAGPLDAAHCPTGSAAFSVTAVGPAPLNFLWQIETAPGVWQTLGNDPGPLPCGGTGFAFPINSPDVSIGVRDCTGRFRIRCIVTSACGTVASNPAALTICAGDFNCDGLPDPDDLADYIAAFFAQPPPPAADYNADGTVDPDDLADFITAFFDGC